MAAVVEAIDEERNSCFRSLEEGLDFRDGFWQRPAIAIVGAGDGGVGSAIVVVMHVKVRDLQEGFNQLLVCG